jgi:hypothetical protein
MVESPADHERRRSRRSRQPSRAHPRGRRTAATPNGLPPASRHDREGGARHVAALVADPHAQPGALARAEHVEHHARLKFVVRVREQIGPKLPLSWLRETLDDLWASDPALVGRVGRGEEPLHIAGFGLAPTRPAAAAAKPSVPSVPPPPKRPASPAAAERGWTTIQIRGDLELRLRTDDPERVAWLARIARRLRAWIEEGEQ